MRALPPRVISPTAETEKHTRDALGFVPNADLALGIDQTGRSNQPDGLIVMDRDLIVVSPDVRRLRFGDGLAVEAEEDTATVTLGRHLVTRGLRPGYTIGAGAGTGATASVVGNDIAGLISITAGTSPATGVQITLTFAQPYLDTNYHVSLTAANSGARGLDTELGTSTKTVLGVQLAISTALTNGSTYQWTYLIVAFNGTS